MNNFANETWFNIIRNATEKEQKIILQALPTKLLQDEINRRNEQSVDILNRIFAIVSDVSDNMTLLEMQNTIKELKNVLNPKHKLYGFTGSVNIIEKNGEDNVENNEE